jgi:hypothetical protein
MMAAIDFSISHVADSNTFNVSAILHQALLLCGTMMMAFVFLLTAITLAVVGRCALRGSQTHHA